MSSDKVWEFEAPRSNHPEAFEAGTVIEIVEPNEDIMETAFDLAGPYEKRGRAIYLSKAEGYLLELCLRRVGEETFTYERLADGGIKQHFDSEYKRRTLQQLMDKITTPEDKELEAFMATAKLKVRATRSSGKPASADKA